MNENKKENVNQIILCNDLVHQYTPVSISTNSTHYNNQQTHVILNPKVQSNNQPLLLPIYHLNQNQQSQQQTNLLPFHQQNQFTINNKSPINQHQNSQIVHSYFKSIQKTNKHISSYTTALKYSQLIKSSLQSNIILGTINISNKKLSIKNLIQQSKLSSEQIKLLQKKTQAQIRSKKLQLLDPYQQISLQELKTQQHQKTQSQQQQSMINMISNAVLSKEQHKRLIQRFRISNKQNQNQRKQRLFQREQRQRSISFEKQQTEQQRRRREIQLRRLSIEQKLTLRKQCHERFIEQQKNTTQKIKQVQKKTFLHQNMQQRYKSQVLLPILEQKKMKLKQLRDFYKRYDISEIKKHQAQYLEKHSQSTEKQTTSRAKVTTFHYNPPVKSKKLTRLLEEENHMAKIKFQEKKRILQQNKLRQLSFLSEIKLKFKPKIDSNKKQEIQQRLNSSKIQAKQQYSQRDLKQLGMRYFQEARTKIKRNIDKQKTQGNDISQQSDDGKFMPMRRNKQKTEHNDKSLREQYQNEFIPVGQINRINSQRESKKIITQSTNSNHRIRINESRRKQIRKIINSQNLDRGQKLQRLRVENEKINQIYKRREIFYRQNEDDQKTRQQAIGLLLNSIQTKMGMIDICSSSK